ncbi:NmrA-like family domain-containing protein 1 [Colletotrichum spaethianum]|uniref:NmrA-like family domain-containing protein 1 n=1 Tax=Colletotrichum spaethianum TaxID=700344 RepID=A0AA37LG75_9PEZI|nr:NmrA-like family domain-containing protein 1 [Colletotrichum spaethianum]GKT46869.1 NmrA-like family domain-containing protein 1 [Colletotrichum spaethianum]
MTSKASLSEVIKVSHTVFLLTTRNFTGGTSEEQLQGKNVADVAAEAGVKHIIYSSLLHVTETTNGRLRHVVHFNDEAEVERCIRSKGIPSTFILPGYFRDNFTALHMIQKGGDRCQISFINAESDIGKYAVAAIRNKAKVFGRQILAAADYYTPSRIISEFQEVTGKPARFVSVDAETYKSFIPGLMADEMLESHLFIEDPGYYAGKDLTGSLELLTEVGLKPTSWKGLLEANKTGFQ